MPIVKARTIARPFIEALREQVACLGEVRLVGILGSDLRASQVYARYAAEACAEVGITFELRRVEPEQVSFEIFTANEDPGAHGVLVFYPVFGGTRDRSLQNEVDPKKDVEGLHAFWASRLYHDVRTVEAAGMQKAILPCTPLGIVKALAVLGVTRRDVPPRRSAEHLEVTIFNRSEVVGRPLAAMLTHDGARVHSFDIDGVILYEGRASRPDPIDRAAALARSDVVVTGVPSRDFPKVRAAEIKAGATCINFSHVNNLAGDVAARAAHTLKRVGPITVAMLLCNTVRLFDTYHRKGIGT